MRAAFTRFLPIVLLAGLGLGGNQVAIAQGQTAGASGLENPLDLLETCIISVIPVGKQFLDEALRPVYDQIQVSPADEMSVGKRISKEVFREHLGQVDVNKRDLAYLRAVGQRVAMGIGNKGIYYTFHMVEKETVNAFAHCGGHVYVYRGLFRRLKNEAQLASVLGHEIAHVDLGHTRDIIKAFIVAGQVQRVLPLVSVDTVRLVAMAAQRAIASLYSEAQELEADETGLKMAFRAGYDPAEGAQYWKDNPDTNRAKGRMEGVNQAVLRSHPSTQQRIQLAERVSRDLKVGQGSPLVVGVDSFNARIPATSR
jgi:predicted Zn-dependent protease